MKSTPLSSLLADDQLLDRVGARLDTDDELGSLLLAVARHVDAPIGRPGPRGRRSRRHRGLTVLAALGVAVSGATVAAAIEGGPGGPSTAADWALGLPFTGSGLVQGRLLVLPSTASPATVPGWTLVGSAAGVAPVGSGVAFGVPSGVPTVGEAASDARAEARDGEGPAADSAGRLPRSGAGTQVTRDDQAASTASGDRDGEFGSWDDAGRPAEQRHQGSRQGVDLGQGAVDQHAGGAAGVDGLGGRAGRR